MVTELKRRVDLPESSHAAKLARSDDFDQRGCGLEPKHTIFLSHSGEQKDFTERLCVELERAHHSPFFDKYSLLKGHDFPSAIIQAAQQCHVAILVLSEEFFTRSRWPMIELNEFVKAQASTNSKLKLLPLFYKISVEEFKDAERRKRWQDLWDGWAAEDIRTNATHQLDVGAWVSALSVVGRKTGLEYVKKVGEVAYVANVVEAVRELKLPCVKYDVSHVQSLRRLCEAIFAEFDESRDVHPIYEVQVVGLLGMGGVGKTTITKAMCNGRFGDFVGDFCHVEFGVKDLGVLRRQVLQDLTGGTSLPNDLDKLKTLLNKCMQHQEVFLCLDNVWHGDIEEAKMYLQLNYKVGSKVLVTSRSREVFQRLGLQDHCMEMPELDECDATKLFLHYVGVVSTNNINELEWDVINGCVQACHFSKRSLHGVRNDSSTQQYLPLALKVWGTQLGQISRCPLEWRVSLEKLSTHKFNHFNDDAHPLFSLLRQGYDSLKPRDQLVFLDLAIFVTAATKATWYWLLEFDIVKWLQHAHGCEVFSIMRSLEALKRKALLDFVMTKKVLEFRIHDLYLDFAEEEVQALESSNQTIHILYDLGGVRLPPKLQRKRACLDLKRMGIYESEVKSIKRDDLLHCSEVEVFQVHGCKNLEELDVEGMDGLRILDVVGCKKLGEKFRGLNKLHGLEWLRLHIINHRFFLGDLLSLGALQFLYLHVGGSPPIVFHPPDLSGCNNLRELIIEGWVSLPNLGNLTMLEKVECRLHWKVESTIGLNSLTNLKVLDLSTCLSLVELPGLCNLDALETLNVSMTDLSELPGIGKLQHLQELDVSECEYLTSLVELEYVTSLRRLDAYECPSLHELPNMSNLKMLEVVDLSEGAISEIPGGFGRLAKNHIFNLVGCVELLEPLVLWLWEQELLPVKGLNDRILLEFSCIEEIEDKLRSNTRKDVAYYMKQVSSKPYEGCGLASSHNSLEEREGGIEYAIKALCEHDDLGILSLVVAKYSTEVVAKTTITELSNHIIDFLNQQLDHSSSERDSSLGHPSFWRILFILEHVMKNDMLTKSLEADNICFFVTKFVMKDTYRFEHGEFWGYLGPVLEQWSSYLNQCCFGGDNSCQQFPAKRSTLAPAQPATAMAPPRPPLKHFRRSDLVHSIPLTLAHEKYRGIRFLPQLGRYISDISPAQPHRRKIWLGTYKTAEEAARAFDAGIFYTKKSITYNFEDSPSILEPLPENLSPEEEHIEIQKKAKAAAARAQPADPKQQEPDTKLVAKSQSYASHHRQNYNHHYNHEEPFYQRHEIPREIQFAVLNR